ncbi:hypothetical protein M5X11_00890 [Paenibacillus alginolyticus]|uniref:hypothetical protein n=1 Tax=Paenibacillus alginolyticus TaxID=59839 RepID=UPI000426B733|nr:hypothetical protein [Paenibacillus alginolyticus]MCY9663543.1 hypothetical protein [Paenibacillus alginolyticus]
MKIRSVIAIAAVFLLLALNPIRTYAEGPYQAYVYDECDHAKVAPNSYLPSGVFSGLDSGAGSFNDPQDLFVDSKGFIYVADTGNNRIVKLNDQFQKVDIIDKLMWNGKETALSGPTGIFMGADGLLVIADKGSGRVLLVNNSKQVQLVIEKPSHPLIPQDFKFKPIKVSADEAGRIYVLSEGQFFGLMQFDSTGQFTGYFGSNKVEVTPAVVLEKFWKSILTKDQRDSMAKLLPIEYSNMDLGPDGFVYTTTIVSENSREEIKKLNPLGNNVLVGKKGELDFGDKEIPIKKSVKQDTAFVDLAVDRDGIIAGLDRTRGRVFEYDQDGNLLAVFGALGNQQGTFLQPNAVAFLNDSILVLDSGKRNITQFSLTEYGSQVRKAVILYNQGLYEEAASIWRNVAKRNIHSDIANVGIAKSLEKNGDYESALYYYKQGADRAGFSNNFSQIRIAAVRMNLPIVMSLLAVAVVGWYGYRAFRLVYAHRGRRKRV